MGPLKAANTLSHFKGKVPGNVFRSMVLWLDASRLSKHPLFGKKKKKLFIEVILSENYVSTDLANV